MWIEKKNHHSVSKTNITGDHCLPSRGKPRDVGGGRVERLCWVNFQCRGVLLTCIIVGQGPTALAVGAGGGSMDTFSLIYPFSSFSLTLGDGPILTEILSQRAVKPNTTN